MILSSEELGILEYLKSRNGTFIPVLEISRRAFGRRKFEDDPNWANGLLTRLVDAALVEVNERGHYRFLENENFFSANASPAIEPEAPPESAAGANEDYFPSTI